MTETNKMIFRPTSGQNIEANCAQDLIKNRIFINPDGVREMWGDIAAEEYTKNMIEQGNEYRQMKMGNSLSLQNNTDLNS